MPFFSVIIATFNRSSFLCKAIDSVLQQTFRDFELLIIDDGSTDDTSEVVKRFNDSRIKYYFIKNTIYIQKQYRKNEKYL